MVGCLFCGIFWAIVAISHALFPPPPEEPKFKEVTDEDIII